MDRGALTQLLGVVALFAGGCASTPAPSDDSCRFGEIQQALTVRCLPHSLNPVTDPADPDFGRVPCEVVEFGSASSDFCNCATAGYRPATQAQTELALATLSREGACQDACCESLCFCELLQLSGDELRACQQGENESIAIDTPGFCYVEPGLGVGDPSTVAGCPANAQELLILTPLGSTHRGIIACETTLG